MGKKGNQNHCRRFTVDGLKRAVCVPLIAIVGLMLLLSTGCARKEKDKVEILISVPELVMDCIAYPECRTTTQFLQIAWEEFASQYEKYDVSLSGGQVKEFPQTGYRENIPEAYGTDHAVDLTFGGYFMLGSYMYDGNVIPLDDIITDRIRFDFTDATWELSRGSNGKVYMMPFYSLQNILCYNLDLFSQCGLDMHAKEEEKQVIQSWSMDMWETTLAALQQKLPEGSYPMLMYAKNEQGDTHTMVQIRCRGSQFFDENGLFSLETPEGIAGLSWIRDNYEKGYYPAGCEDMEIVDCQKLFLDGKLAFYIYNSSINGLFRGMQLGYVNFPGGEEHGACSNWITGFMVFDNGDEKKIEVLKDFLKYIYNSRTLMDYATGGNPCAKSVVERWHDKLPLNFEFLENEDYSVDFTANNPNWAGVREAFWPHIHALLTGEETPEDAAEGIDRDCNAVITSVERRLHA